MKIKQRIHIGGRNWNDIIALPCFRELTRYNHTSLLVLVAYKNGERVGHKCDDYCSRALVGDDIVQYEDGSWGLITFDKIAEL